MLKTWRSFHGIELNGRCLRFAGPSGTLASAVQRTVEVDSRADQRQVGEGLREVSQRLSRRANLLGVEPEMVGVGEHLFEDHPSLPDSAGPGERLDIPERAQVERALAVGDPI